jgi:hypothetical protein
MYSVRCCGSYRIDGSRTYSEAQTHNHSLQRMR